MKAPHQRRAHGRVLRATAAVALPALFALCSLMSPRTAAAQSEVTLEDVAMGAWGLLEAGDINGAADVFQQLVDAAPDWGPGHAGLAAVAAATGQWPTARTHADQAIALDDTIAAAHTIRCRAVIVAGDPAAALPSCDRAITLNPDNAVPYRSACAAALALYEWNQAIGYCRGAIDRSQQRPGHAGSHWRLGVALSNVGDTTNAVDACRAAIEIAPTDPMSHYCLGTAHISAGAHNTAMPHCAQAALLAPDNALAWFCRGMAALGLNNVDDARADCSRATQLAPHEALGHFCLGRIARETGRHADAVPHLQEALTLNPRLVAARGTLGEVLTHAGQLEDGERWLRDALERAPSPDRHAQLGYNLQQQHRYDDAVSAYRRAFQLDSTNAGYLNNSARCLLAAGDADAALEEMRRAVTADPENPLWRVRSIDLALEAGNHDTAVDLAERAAAAFPNNADIAATQCNTLARHGDTTRAQLVCNSAGDTHTQDPRPLRSLGSMFIGMQRNEDAVAALTEAQRRAPDNTTALNLAIALLNTDRSAQALSELDALAQRAAADPRIHFFRSVALDDLGRSSEATRAACHAAELDPGHAGAATRCSQP